MSLEKETTRLFYDYRRNDGNIRWEVCNLSEKKQMILKKKKKKKTDTNVNINVRPLPIFINIDIIYVIKNV